MHQSLELYAEIVGEGSPVFFLPGLGGDHRAFIGLQKLLANKRRCFAIDPRDAGKSQRALQDYSLKDMAHDVLALMDQQQLDQIDLIGHSMGGMISMHLALLAPSRIRSLTLMSCHPQNYPWKCWLVESWIRLRQTLNPVEFASVTLPWLLGTKAFENTAHISGMIRHAERHPSHQEPDAFARQGRAVLNHDVVSSLHLLELPVLVIAGSEDRVTPPETSKTIVDHVPHGRFEIFDQVGHLPHIEAPARLATLLNIFLDDPASYVAKQDRLNQWESETP